MDDLKPTAPTPQTAPDPSDAASSPHADVRELSARELDRFVAEHLLAIGNDEAESRLRESADQIEARATVRHDVAVRRLTATARGAGR
jgi:hypothetical protein